MTAADDDGEPTPAGRRGRARPGACRSAIAALGVVFGDLGTSGLYALQESFDAQTHSLAVSRANVLGVLSLVLWSLVVVVSVKYLLFVMRADNRGEGGILALTSLVIPPGGRARARCGSSSCSACSAPPCSTATG